MHTPLRSILKARRVAAVAVGLAVVPFAASTASAASHVRGDRGKHATQTVTAAATPAAAAAPGPAPAAPAPSVTSVISIGGYVFYNLTYAEAVDAWYAAVAAAPAGYTPPPVYSVSVDTTVSGTVEDGNG